MFEIVSKIWYFIIILPILILIEGYKMLKKTMSKKGNYLDKFLYLSIVLLIILLIITWIMGYR